MNPAVVVPPAQGRMQMMTTDQIIEKALREEGIFPPSVLDSRYGEHAEMTKVQLIEKTLSDMRRHWSWGDGSRPGSDAGYLPVVIAELGRRLPDGILKTCGSFRHLNAACCDTCHTFYPHHRMRLIVLPDGGRAWVCHDIEWAIFPERYAQYQERLRSSPELRTLMDRFGADSRPEN
jgi:hypothetical protein